MVFNDIPWMKKWTHPKNRPAVIAENNLIMR